MINGINNSSERILSFDLHNSRHDYRSEKLLERCHVDTHEDPIMNYFCITNAFPSNKHRFGYWQDLHKLEVYSLFVPECKELRCCHRI